ncbi:MAG: hypothetical protein DRJ69_05350 [Thermoprotei archaeon]|nr:MAG: hypothetical protein DRJ69_05350 [Thermoprotei archaeon]
MEGRKGALLAILVALALSLASSSTERVYGEPFSDPLMFTEPEEWGISADVFVPYHSEVVWIACNNTTKAVGFHIWKFPVWVGCVVKIDNDGSTEVVIHADEFTVGRNQYLLVEMNNSWFWLGVVTWEGVSHITVLKT